MTDTTGREDIWPALPLEAWQDTYATLHQIASKIRLALSPVMNHWWPG